MIHVYRVCLFQIQESANLNQQWILMDGMSDTSLDAEYSCRLRAVDRINFRLKPKADKLLENLNLITFWKTGRHLMNKFVLKTRVMCSFTF